MAQLNDQKIYEWFQSANAGDCLPYYYGFIAKDVKEGREVGGLQAVRDLYDSGFLCLTQKKISRFQYEYRATVRKNVQPVSPPYRFVDLPTLRSFGNGA